MTERAKKWVIGSSVTGITAAVVSAISHTLTRKLVKVAIERDGVKNVENSSLAKKQLTGFKETEEFLELAENSALSLEAKQLKEIKIIGYDGTELVGHLRIKGNAKRIILAMHGWRSGWSKDFGMIADFWHNEDCNVLYVEQRGQNNSGGEYIGFGLIERYDCKEWVKWLCEQSDMPLPIYLAGISMGASTVLMAADLDMPENVHGIIADCGFTSPHEIWKHVVQNNLHIPYVLRGKIVDSICKKKLNMGSKSYSTQEALAVSSIPVLLIHGADDHFVPIEMTYENYKACNAPKRLLVVPGADHAMSYYIAKTEYESALRSFWREFD